MNTIVIFWFSVIAPSFLVVACWAADRDARRSRGFTKTVALYLAGMSVFAAFCLWFGVARAEPVGDAQKQGLIAWVPSANDQPHQYTDQYTNMTPFSAALPDTLTISCSDQLGGGTTALLVGRDGRLQGDIDKALDCLGATARGDIMSQMFVVILRQEIEIRELQAAKR